MIMLTRLSGAEFVLNSDLIERIDRTPDSVVTLVDGTKYVVLESLEQIIEAVRRHRQETLQEAWLSYEALRGAQPGAIRGDLAPVTPLRGDR